MSLKPIFGKDMLINWCDDYQAKIVFICREEIWADILLKLGGICPHRARDQPDDDGYDEDDEDDDDIDEDDDDDSQAARHFPPLCTGSTWWR